MKRSTRRILTTHTGSLPRPQDLLALMTAKEAGEPYDREALNTSIRSAVAAIARRQTAAGVDVINDGEMSKPGYSNYIKDRMSGFEGESVGLGSGGAPRIGDLQEFPEYAARLFPVGTSILKTPACTGPISYQDTRDLNHDIANLKEAALGVKAEEVFMSAASPGVISLFLADHHYGSHEAYLAALADAMKTEYQAIHDAGFLLQVDCPDLAMGRHIQFNDLSVPQFRKKAALHVEALNHALAGIPAESVRLHLCWGNYEGPHHRDVPLKDILDVVLKANVAAISFEGSNPRHEHEWRVWEDVKLGGKALIPGVLDSSCNFIEHPDLIAERIVRLAGLVGRENVIAGSDCGFSTFAGFVVVDPNITWAKLNAMAEGARKASRELWRKATRAPAPRKPTKRTKHKASKSRMRRR
ncbi:MAG: cobalamin-independent methionine synthase II family protein [Deltaproteobacteria bacterium]|nr:cobalamin-independent methionine synthase II family protein [Deltaproteobacteria bacterium]